MWKEGRCSCVPERRSGSCPEEPIHRRFSRFKQARQTRLGGCQMVEGINSERGDG